jgi:IS605 OrfB family transposase
MRRSERLAESFVDEVFHRVTREVVEYAESVESSVVVLEDLTYIGESMDDGGFMNWRLHGCGFGKLHVQIRYGTVQYKAVRRVFAWRRLPCTTRRRRATLVVNLDTPHDRRRSSGRATLAG